MKFETAPPNPALAKVKNEPLRLLMAEEEGEYIVKRIRETKRWIWIASIAGLLGPVVLITLFWNEAAFFEWLFAVHTLLGFAGIGVVFLAVIAPVWAAVRIGFEYQALKRYREYEEDHNAFLTKYNRCPLEARTQMRARAQGNGTGHA